MLYKLVFQKMEMWEVLNKTEKEKKIRKGGEKGDSCDIQPAKITAIVPSFRNSRDRNTKHSEGHTWM